MTVAKCGCASDTGCLCTVHGGSGVVVSGIGSPENPYVVSASGDGNHLSVQNTPTVLMTLTGSGSAASPWVLSAQATGGVSASRLTASATWTKPAGARYVWVRVVGSGGAGGGAAAPTSSSQSSAGGGGGAGGYAEGWFTASTLPATVDVQVSTGGTGPVNNDGNPGGPSSFGTFLTANGGAGGQNGTVTGSSLFRAGGTGGTAGGSAVLHTIAGMDGGAARIVTGTIAVSSVGGNSPLGYGGRGLTGNGNGVAATGFGGGGSGAFNSVSQSTNRSGGAGGGGAVIIVVFF